MAIMPAAKDNPMSKLEVANSSRRLALAMERTTARRTAAGDTVKAAKSAALAAFWHRTADREFKEAGL